MTAEELRIGNIIKTLQGYGRVETIRHTGQNGYGVVLENELSGTYIEYCEGVPLTGEVLLKCGFEDDNPWKKDNIRLDSENRLHVVDDSGYGVIIAREVVYLHELQNIIHALTGKELEVKL